MKVPDYIKRWFSSKGWDIHPHQRQMIENYAKKKSSLLVAPTGAGKTLSGFLPSIIDINEKNFEGLHTIYISPLKALANDIERNLQNPIAEMGLDISVESRTGDTSSKKRQRQRKKPPNILIITPESLMLMLSYKDSDKIFRNLKMVVIDEIHSFAGQKRGDFTSLILTKLASFAPKHIRFGLSATVADENFLCNWLSRSGEIVKLIKVEEQARADISILHSRNRIPYGGHMASYAIDDVYNLIKKHKNSIIFVNTRAQSEIIFQKIWEINEDALPIAVYHGSLEKEHRRKIERLMSEGSLKSIVATSALELGIDWGDVELVIQVGAPKGVSRLLQRIGRSNHKLDLSSKAVLIPGNCFEALECEAAKIAIEEHDLDGNIDNIGSQDVIIQFIINSACHKPINKQEIYSEITNSYSYRDLNFEEFERIFEFAVDGGYALENYDRFQRLIYDKESDSYKIASRSIATRHRMNIGVIVEAGKVKVKKLYSKSKRGGKILGEIEEYFIQQLSPGDSFLFAGEILKFERIRDMFAEVTSAKNLREPKVPSYVGGNMPLSSNLSEQVRRLVNNKSKWQDLPDQVQEWLDLQKKYSIIPEGDQMLVESFKDRGLEKTVFYSFEGRKANNSLGMLITRRMEKLGLKPLSFIVSDYGLAISSLVRIENPQQLMTRDIMGEELEDWIITSPMLKRSFRHIATITGLTEQRSFNEHKSLKQVTFSTDLIYDVLMKYDPSHILLKLTRDESERELLDLYRLANMIQKFEDCIIHKNLDKPSPFAIPILMEVRNEHIKGAGVEQLMRDASAREEAEYMIDEIKNEVR